MALRPAACASRDEKGFGSIVEFHSFCEVRWRSSSSSSSNASVSFSARTLGGLPPWATKIANAKAMVYSGRIMMLLTEYCRKTFPGMVSTLYLFGVTVTSGSVPSRITSRISNNSASEAGLAHAQSQSCCNDVNVSSERLSMIFCQRDARKELLAHLHLHLRSWCLKFTYDMVSEGPEYGQEERATHSPQSFSSESLSTFRRFDGRTDTGLLTQQGHARNGDGRSERSRRQANGSKGVSHNP